VAPDHAVAFGPGRVNLIGEHTDYNDGLSLPFAIEPGVTVTADAVAGDEINVRSGDHGEQDCFALDDAAHTEGWRAFVRGAVAELRRAGFPLRAARMDIAADLPEGSGLSSSAALEVALCLALLALVDIEDPDRVALARLCSRVEADWAGANTGLLDQLAVLLGQHGQALRIDFRSLEIETVALRLGAWRLATVDSGESHSLATSGYNERRAECERARDLLGLESLRDAQESDLKRLPEPLDRRVRHVSEENARVDQAVRALQRGDLEQVGLLLFASHASLRDLYDASTDAVEDTVERCRRAGAAGARMMGGGFGGQVLGLFPPGSELPDGALVVKPAAGARLLEVH
jgi:galactokinase